MKFIKIIFFTFLILSNQQIFNMTIFGKGSYIDYIAQIKKLVNDAQKNVLDNDFKTFEDNNKRINDIIDIIEKYATNEIQNSAPLREYLASKNFFPKGDKNIYGDAANKNAINNFRFALNNQRDVLLDKLKELYSYYLKNNTVVAVNIIDWASSNNLELHNLSEKRFNLISYSKLHNELEKIHPWTRLIFFIKKGHELELNIPNNILTKEVKKIIWNQLSKEYKNLLQNDIYIHLKSYTLNDNEIFDTLSASITALYLNIVMPLEKAILENNKELFKKELIVAKKNDTLNRQNPETGNTALNTAIIYEKSANFIKQLFDADADPIIENNEGKTFFDYLKDMADEEYKKEIEQIVKEHKKQIKANLPEVLPKDLKNIIADYIA